MGKLTHFDEDGKAAMVDVSDKEITERTASAEGSIAMAPETLALIEASQLLATLANSETLALVEVSQLLATMANSETLVLSESSVPTFPKAETLARERIKEMWG